MIPVGLVSLLILPSLVAIESKRLRVASLGYCAQSILMSLVFLLDGYASWALVALIGNGTMITALLVLGARLTKDHEEPQRFKSKLSAVVAISFTLVTTLILSAFISLRIAISLVIFSLGFYTLIMKSNLIKTLIGFCLVENGLHLSIFFIAPEIPVLLEIGIASYTIGSVMIILIILVELYRKSQVVNNQQLMEVRW